MSPGLVSLSRPLLGAHRLKRMAPRCDAEAWAAALSAAMVEFDITSTIRMASFLAQLMHESRSFTAFEELLSYRDPAAIVRTFRRFDLDKDRVVDPEEIEFARAYVGRPEQLANAAYAGKNGNGDERSGDGWRYRGRGPIQITGRANYRACGDALCLDLLASPELLLIPVHGARSAGWYWSSRKLNDLADRGDTLGITKRVNGGTHGLAERLDHFKAWRQELVAA